MTEAVTTPLPVPGTPVPPRPLLPIVLGLGAVYGYSGADLTNVRDAALRHEVPFLPLDSPDAADAVIELRIHGVGGAPPEENLESPATLQVAGDGTAGFYRAWHPGVAEPAGPLRREAYCWGKLNYRAATRALWLLLVAFMIVNVAHWSLPDPDYAWVSPRRNAICRALLRLLGLAFTAAFIGTAILVLADLVAWQAPQRGALPTWLGAYAHLGVGPRLALALLAVLLVVAALWWISVQTVSSYEQWAGGASAEEDARWPLTSRSFWHGERTVVRQRGLHVSLACAEVVFFAAVPGSSARAAQVVLVVVAALIALTATAITASTWTDRIYSAGVRETHRDDACRYFMWTSLVLAAATALTRFWWRPNKGEHALPTDQPMQTWLVFAELAIVLALTAGVVLQRPWKQADVMGNGMAAPLLALLAALIATIFGAAFTLTIANLLGRPQVTLSRIPPGGGAKVLYLPSTIYAGGIGMVVTVASVLVFGLAAVAVMLRRAKTWGRTDDERGDESVLSGYPDASATAGPRPKDAARCVASVWARSSLTDLAPVALTAIALPTALALVTYQVWLVVAQRPGSTFLLKLALWGGTIGVLATGYFLVQLRGALTRTAARKRFGTLWDVGTFWPRACHPFAPPSYAERSIPEVVTRIRRLAGDVVRADEDPLHPHPDPALAQQGAERVGELGDDDPVEARTPVLLCGYSQGTPISVAVMAQLPAAVRERVALLTLAAPVRRLYGRAFPAYFGPAHLGLLRDRLTAHGQVRWRNLVRRSDYIGGWALERVPPPSGAVPVVDHEILDPPVLWPDGDPSPPPVHTHSDWFPDPQTRPYAEDLAAMLR